MLKQAIIPGDIGYSEGTCGIVQTVKRIELRSQRCEAARLIADHFSLKMPVARALAARGFEADVRLEQFLVPSLRDGLPAPQLLRNLDKACELIAHIIAVDGKIAICSDFDVDGLSGAAQVISFFQAVGVSCECYVPDRFKDGYGLNCRIVDEAVASGCTLLITIDFGTKNRAELEYARTRGVASIVVDHHHVGNDSPPADVFINPQHPECGFAGGILSAAGLAWYLIVGLRKALPQAQHVDPKEYLDLACLGTICDMVPLQSVNRVIAKRGLELLGQTRRPGLLAMKQLLSLNDTVKGYDVSFRIGPQINAAGRLASGSIVIDLLTAKSVAVAMPLAKKLVRFNKERQDVEISVKTQAEKAIFKLDALPAGLVVWGEEFHTGVIGIVAQRLTEQFHRPAAVLGQDVEGVYKGSVRGIKGFSVVEALEQLSLFLIKFGGHTGAGGFSLVAKNLEAFREAFKLECARQIAPEDFIPVVFADAEVCLSDLSHDILNQINLFAPCGVGNAAPVFLCRNVEVIEVKILKNAHLKVLFSNAKGAISGLMWRTKEHPALYEGAKVDVAFKLDSNNFRGFTELQATIQAVQPAMR
jgi:single-stranded-DNA-specific exonuclease